MPSGQPSKQKQVDGRKARSSSAEKPEIIPLWRAGSMVSSLAGAYGRGLRETRLTALLGYLIALDPEPWMETFDFPGRATDVTVETYHETGRSDIEVKTDQGIGVIEAKVDATDPSDQSLKYHADWRVLLTQYVPTAKQRGQRGVQFLRWSDLLEPLRRQTKSSNHRIRFVATDLIAYLQEHRMVSNKNTVEVYAREINNENTLALFLHGRMYGCPFKKGSRLPAALYFAPHFGQAIARLHPGVHVGVSYIARIEKVEVVMTWKDWSEAVQTHRGTRWLKRHSKVIDPLRRTWTWDGNKAHHILLLGEPRLVFTPAIRKDNLQAGHGFLSKQFYTFDELYQAWAD